MPGLTLTMQNVNGAPENAGALDTYIETGAMGDCVSVIVAWNPNIAGQFGNMRGFHGAGGFERQFQRAVQRRAEQRERPGLDGIGLR